MLLQGFDDEDADTVRQALNHPFIKHMDVEYARLARDLPLPEGIAAPKGPVVRENAAPSYVSPNATSVVTADVEVSHVSVSFSSRKHNFHFFVITYRTQGEVNRLMRTTTMTKVSVEKRTSDFHLMDNFKYH